MKLCPSLTDVQAANAGAAVLILETVEVERYNIQGLSTNVTELDGWQNSTTPHGCHVSGSKSSSRRGSNQFSP